MSRYAARDLGNQLRRARQAAGLSVIDAAEILRVTRPMIYNYEKGKYLPSLDVLIRAAEAWGVTFRLAGCKVLPESSKPKAMQSVPSLQLELPYTEERLYKQASVRIKQKGRRVFINIVLPDKGRGRQSRSQTIGR